MTKLTLACGLALSLSLMACASAPKTATVPVASGTSAAPAAGTATAQASTKPKLICEESKPLGSLLPQRICMTPEEAAARKTAAQNAMRNLQSNSAPTMREGGGSSGG